MFGCERLMGMLSRRDHNKRFPEATVMETVSVHSACTLLRLQVPPDSPIYNMHPLYPRESFQLLGFESDQETEDFDRRYTQYMVQRVTRRASGYLYGESRVDILGHVEYGHLVDFFRVYHKDYGDLATKYEEEKQQANNSSFPTMREWMPEDNLGLDESRIR